MNDIQITEDELDSFTKDYLLDLAVPSVVGFQGSLGAGKTTIIKNIINNNSNFEEKILNMNKLSIKNNWRNTNTNLIKLFDEC